MANDRTRYEDALNRGHSYSWDQNWEDAIREFEAAIEEYPNEPAPYAGLGMAYLEQNKLGKALENYKLAARHSRGDIIYLRQVADVQERLGLQEEAGKTYMAIGELELNRKRLAEAMDNWTRAINLEPNLLRAHQRLASVYERQGSAPNAIREYLEIARILYNQDEKNKAKQACQLALKLDPRNAEVLTALELIRSGDPWGKKRGGTVKSSEMSAFASMMETAIAEKEGMTAKKGATASPVASAQRLASEQLASELFGGEDFSMETSALLSKALDYQQRNMVNEAISAYEDVLAAGVNSTAVHFNLGLLYQNKLRFDDAIRQFELSVNDREYRLASSFALGESYRAKGQIERAIEHFINVLKIVDLNTVQHSQADRLIELYGNLSDSLMAQGEHDHATKFANSLVDFFGQKGWEDKAKDARERLNALSESGLMTLGDMLTAGSSQVLESLYLSQEYEKRGMFDTAIEEIYRAIQLSYDYMPAHIRLGELLAKQGNQEAAAQKFVTIANTYKVRGDIHGAMLAYEQVLNFTPLDTAIRARLIDMLKQHGQIDRALEHYKAMGDAYYQLAQVDKARAVYQDALKLAPRGSADQNWKLQFLSQMAEIDMQRLDWRRALSAYKELRELDPEDERIAITLVDLYYRVGQPINAVNELDNYMRQLVRAGRGAKVVGILEDMVRQRPSDPHLVERLSRLYIQQKRREDAIEILDKLGETQLEANDTEAAIQTIETILKLKPPNAISYQQLLAQLKQ